MSSHGSRARILDSALTLLAECGHAGVTMAEIAKASGVSRQAVYLHFANRAELLLALVHHAHEKRGVAKEIQKIVNAPTGGAALAEMVASQARSNPAIWAVARALDAVRRTDKAAERSWQDRLNHRLEGCRQIIARLKADQNLRDGVDPAAAADLLWTVTSLRVWEDLVLQRGWPPARYRKYITRLLREMLTRNS